MKIYICIVISSLGLSIGQPAGIGGGHGGGGLIGGGVHGQGYDERPDPFHFQYGVHDDKYYTDFSEVRSGDVAGNIKGEYTVALPDGRIQHVIYHADGASGGTIMEVTYEWGGQAPDCCPPVADSRTVVIG
eukprot:TRINITY_DN1028_c0_g1_i1.p2 TRINITY_DN1028_c0_g1~~TRINITY_DN1028_c0_g1_i1.p2  ORF type:complete len:131 (-),score=37.51 TRINITY_DN1028_c0_g1_i1:32-424(-)